MRARRALVALSATALAAGAALTTTPWAGTATAATAKAEPATAFLAFDGVPGDAVEPGFVGQIEVSSFSFGASNPVAAGPGGGGSVGRASVSSVTLTKPVDRATVPLLDRTLTGRAAPTAVLTVCGDARCTPALQEVLTLGGVLVESSQQSGSGRSITESVALAFRQLTVVRGDQRAAYDPAGDR